ncbi:MAG: hypothetical protein AAB217_05450 [Chloroflexota bacterium]
MALAHAFVYSFHHSLTGSISAKLFSIVGAVEEARPTGTAMEDHVGYGKAVVR